MLSMVLVRWLALWPRRPTLLHSRPGGTCRGRQWAGQRRCLSARMILRPRCPDVAAAQALGCSSRVMPRQSAALCQRASGSCAHARQARTVTSVVSSVEVGSMAPGSADPSGGKRPTEPSSAAGSQFSGCDRHAMPGRETASPLLKRGSEPREEHTCDVPV